MNNKTAMQIAIDELNCWWPNPTEHILLLRRLVELEKNQITQAHQAGQFSADGKDPSISESLEYYVSTYQNK